MKIMFIIPTLKQGGMERVVSELANYANTKGYDVSIIFLEKNSLFYHLDERINTYFPSFGYQKTFISKLIFKIKLLFYIRKIVLKVQPISVFSPRTISDSFKNFLENLCILMLMGLLPKLDLQN